MTGIANYILFYDGECRFCNRWVQWVVDRDEKKVFMFAALESDFFKDLQSYLNIERSVSSIAIIDIKDLLLKKRFAQLIYRSEAVACLFANLQPNAFVYKALKVTPRFISDFVYSCVAGIRKLLAVPNCRLYTNEEKDLFLNERDFVDFISLSL
jgi:predicted DCC family thiol-disulfide oxidoreductase YuxK